MSDTHTMNLMSNKLREKCVGSLSLESPTSHSEFSVSDKCEKDNKFLGVLSCTKYHQSTNKRDGLLHSPKHAHSPDRDRLIRSRWIYQ